MICYCGHDCSRCRTYLATVNDDAAMRQASAKFYKDEFNHDIPLEKLRCMGGRSGDVFEGCRHCPFIKCCKEHGYEYCSDCPEYPCANLTGYMEKYINKANQVI